MSEWISVCDDLPDEECTCLCYFSDGTIETFPYEMPHELWGVAPFNDGDIVTHWMPLPDPPQGEAK